MTARQTIANALWRRYRLTQSDDALNALVVHYQRWTISCALKIAARRVLPRELTVEDLFSVAYKALVKCIESWKPERSAFLTWAGIRVRGAVRDAIRDGRHARRRGRTPETLTRGDFDDYSRKARIDAEWTREGWWDMALAGLKPVERQVIREHYLEGRNWREVAKMHDRSEAWAYWMRGKALKRLRKEEGKP